MRSSIVGIRKSAHPYSLSAILADRSKRLPSRHGVTSGIPSPSANGSTDQAAVQHRRRRAGAADALRRGPRARARVDRRVRQAMLDLPVSVGGRTALEFQGYAHYLRQTQQDIHLYSATKLPGWLHKLPLKARFLTHNRSRFLPDTGLAGSGAGAHHHEAPRLGPRPQRLDPGPGAVLAGGINNRPNPEEVESWRPYPPRRFRGGGLSARQPVRASPGSGLDRPG